MEALAGALQIVLLAQRGADNLYDILTISS